MGRKILYVEDDPLAVEMMEVLLTQAGYDVRHAMNGDDAIRIAYAEKPDLILMDICLPGMNGREIMNTLKEDSFTENIKVVALTALAGNREKILSEGFDDFISKPIVDHKAFLATIASFLR